jgi:hypothetical protein
MELVMEYDPNVFINQYPLVKRFVYHYLCYKELINAYKKRNCSSEFITHTIDAHLLQATLYWCMVFGSAGSNPTHWQNLKINNRDDLKKDFRMKLSRKIKISESQWDHYGNTLIKFRNKFVAHKELVFKEAVPDFTLALKVALFYDEWIRNIISPDIFEGLPLKKSAIEIKNEIDRNISIYEFGCKINSNATIDIKYPIIKKIWNFFRKKNIYYYQILFNNFYRLFNKDFSPDIVNLLNSYPVKDIQFLHLTCKEKSGDNDFGFKNPERISILLNNEITRRIQNRTVLISILALVISLVSVIITIINK